MSKMSQLHAELSEQAAELGFESLGEAEQAGYGVDYENGKLIPTKRLHGKHLMQYCNNQYKKATLAAQADIDEAYKEAHEAWLKDRKDLCKRLRTAMHKRRTIQDYHLANLLEEAHDFIQRGEC